MLSDVGAEPPLRDIVLVVDDNDSVSGLVACILERRGHRVLRARDGAECERVFSAHESEIALVVLDCRLPDADGISLCGQLRARVPGLPVLLTSGKNYAGEQTRSDGPTAFLAKPFFPSHFIAAANALMGAIA